MANIFLNDVAFARLRAAKKKNQSYSEVVIENVKPKLDWNQFYGCMKGLDAEKVIAKIKKERNRRFD